MLDVIEERWENGSEFHLMIPPIVERQRIHHPWSKAGRFFGSGRDALKSLLLFGQQKRGWRRIWIPSYYCYEVVEAIISTGIELFIYHDNIFEKFPDLPSKNILKKDVILIVNFFGLRNKPILPIWDDIDIIEDHTHDPWSKWAESSHAEFCFASLRKTLPIADGGILWSPLTCQLPLQPAVTSVHQIAASLKWSSMFLKSLYLKGHPVLKETFRIQAIAGEKQIVDGVISGMTEISKAIIDCFPCVEWRKKRLDNFLFFREKIKNYQFLIPTKIIVDIPFSIILLFDSAEQRDNIFHELIKNNIYPALLWPLKKSVNNIMLHEQSISLSRKILSIHCDMRYNNFDMERVAEIVVNSFKKNEIR